MKTNLVNLVLVIACFSLCISNADAQEVTYPTGRNFINFGVGLSTGLTNVVIPPVSIQYEHVVAEFGDRFGVNVGAVGGLYSTRAGNTSIVNKEGDIAALGCFCYYPVERLDLYSGFLLGVHFYDSSTAVTKVFPCIGARYFFAGGFGAFMQIGGVGTINLGISLMF